MNPAGVIDVESVQVNNEPINVAEELGLEDDELEEFEDTDA
jgi:hypothetical protein